MENVWIAVVGAGTVVLTAYATYLLMKMILKCNNVAVSGHWVWICAFLVNFQSALYIHNIFPYFYQFSYTTQPWHNITYIFMRLFGMLSLTLYFQIGNHYLERITLREWLLFTVCLTVTNAVKPNFIVGFAPMMLIMLIKDFIRLHGKKAFQMIMFGCAVLVSLSVLLFQTSVLYPQGGESGIVVDVSGLIVFFTPMMWLQILCSVGFPLVLTGVCIIKKDRQPFLAQAWLIYIITVVQYLIIHETGPRANDGNFAWSFMFGAYFVHVVCIAKLIEWIKTKKYSCVLRCVLGLLCAWGIISGLVYFGILLTGRFYYF